MIRLFNAYFPTRTLLLTVTEAITCHTWVSCWRWSSGQERLGCQYLPPVRKRAWDESAWSLAVFLILMYYFDLVRLICAVANRREVVTRLVGVLGCAFVALRSFITRFLKSAWPAARCGWASASSESRSRLA